jgi:hypothetical protein
MESSSLRMYVKAARRLRELRAREELGKSEEPFPVLENSEKHVAGAKLTEAIDKEREDVNRLVSEVIGLDNGD